MITLIIRLSAICAVCSLLELASTGTAMRGSLRLICGMIMLTVTMAQAESIVALLMEQRDLMGIFECIMR